MFKEFAVVALAALTLAGCASVPMESKEDSSKAKEFAPPVEGNAGLYIYRAGGVGSALKKDIWVNGECIGESAPNVFFYEEVAGGDEYKISTESEFSPNHLKLKTEPGQHYFVQQYIKMGLFVGGANLRVVEGEKAKKAMAKLEMAKKGKCSKAKP